MRLSDEIHHGLQKRFVVETALCQIIVGAGLQPALPVFRAVFVRHDHRGQGFQTGVFLDKGYQLDAIHARHIHVGDDEIKITRARGVPAIHAIHGNLDLVAVPCEQLPLQFAHRQ